MITTGQPPQSGNQGAARLRLAELHDVPELVSLYQHAKPEQPESDREMVNWLEYGGALLLESETGTLISALRWVEDAKGWRLDRLATLPEYRGQGLGRWLMTKVEALAIQRNIAGLHLTLEQASEDLLYYYRRMGYDCDTQGDKAVLHKRVGGVWQYKT